MSVEIRVPDIGDFRDVEVIEVPVKAGDTVQVEDPVITLESDKASIDVPTPTAGTIKELRVSVGDRVSKGSLILILEASAPAESAEPADTAEPAEPAAPKVAQSVPAAPAAAPVTEGDRQVDLLVLGAGPGGYTAAFRAADLGKRVLLVERYPALGGVCLNVGCIPSKALLHAAKVISETREMSQHGIVFGKPEVDTGKLRSWKNSVVSQLTGGLAQLAKKRGVEVVQGTGRFTSPHNMQVETADGAVNIAFKQAVIAAGSRITRIPGMPDADPRLLDSTSALELDDIPGRLLVIGGGIIGLEMATVYHELGARVTVVELMDGLIPGADRDIVRPLQKRITGQYENIFLKTRVTAVTATDTGLEVAFEGGKAPATDVFDRVLVAVGRQPNGHEIGADQAGVSVDEKGFIAVDSQQRTNVSHIFAIGDIVGNPMLAHKAVHEGKVAGEASAGLKTAFDTSVIPSVAYTDPEVAWVGLTETQAKEQGIEYGKGVFPWAASGRSLSLGRSEGITKLLFDTESSRVLGAGIVGTNAGDLIAEVALAIEMGSDASDIGLTIHPHPTLSETVAMSAEAFEGTITDLYMPKR